jgi:hypothetical protein
LGHFPSPSFVAGGDRCTPETGRRREWPWLRTCNVQAVDLGIVGVKTERLRSLQVQHHLELDRRLHEACREGREPAERLRSEKIVLVPNR